MAEHSTTGSTGPRRLSRLYGIRLLYRPEGRRRLAAGAAIFAVLAYTYGAVLQLVSLQGVNLRYDFREFYNAAATLNAGRDPYGAFLDHCPAFHWCLGGYIYPPLLAEVLRPLALLPFPAALRTWLAISQLCLLGAVLVMWWGLRTRVPAVCLYLLLVATLAFRPLQYSIYFGQVGLVLGLLLAGATAAAMRADPRDDRLAGWLLGVAAVLRVSPVLLLPALLRRRHGVLSALTAAALTLGALTLATSSTIEYFTAVLPRIGASTGILDNQAPQGLVIRAAQLAGVAPPPGWVISALLAVLVLGPTCWLALRRDGDAAWRGAVMAALLAAMPLVSSLTWHHHLVTELLVLGALSPAMARPRMLAVRWLAISAYPLLWVDRHYTDPLVGLLGLTHPAGWRILPFLIVTGVNLAGMACLWAAALVALRRLPGLAEAVDEHPVAIVDQVSAG